MLDFNFSFENLEDRKVIHDLINQQLVSKFNIPHELAFLKLFQNFLSKDTPPIFPLAYSFKAYTCQYYSQFFLENFWRNDSSYYVIFRISEAIYALENKYIYEFNDIDTKKAMMMGDIVTDYLIRYLGYDLIKCSGQKVIITSKNNCDKLYLDYLYQGYSLQRLEKVYLEGTSENQTFYKLAVLPTKDIGIPFEEIIEGPDGIFRKVLTNKK